MTCCTVRRFVKPFSGLNTAEPTFRFDLLEVGALFKLMESLLPTGDDHGVELKMDFFHQICDHSKVY